MDDRLAKRHHHRVADDGAEAAGPGHRADPFEEFLSEQAPAEARRAPDSAGDSLRPSMFETVQRQAPANPPEPKPVPDPRPPAPPPPRPPPAGPADQVPPVRSLPQPHIIALAAGGLAAGISLAALGSFAILHFRSPQPAAPPAVGGSNGPNRDAQPRAPASAPLPLLSGSPDGAAALPPSPAPDTPGVTTPALPQEPAGPAAVSRNEPQAAGSDPSVLTRGAKTPLPAATAPAKPTPSASLPPTSSRRPTSAAGTPTADVPLAESRETVIPARPAEGPPSRPPEIPTKEPAPASPPVPSATTSAPVADPAVPPPEPPAPAAASPAAAPDPVAAERTAVQAVLDRYRRRSASSISTRPRKSGPR